MKKWITLILPIALSAGIIACSSDDDKGTDPTTLTPDDFTNPTGTLSESNATQVSNAALSTFGASNIPGGDGGFTNVQIASRGQVEFDDQCFDPQDFLDGKLTFSGSCLAEDFCPDGGTGSGSFSTEFDINSTETPETYVLKYNNFSVNCTGETSLSCDGTITTATATDITCYDVTCNVDGSNQTAKGCKSSEGFLVTDGDGNTYVFAGSGSVNAGCTTATLTIKDSTGDKTVSCDTKTVLNQESCNDIGSVLEVENCVVN